MNIEKKTPERPYTKPIPIPINHTNCELTQSYDLKLNTFDPNKCSPPSNWNARLFFRFYGGNTKTRCKLIAK